MTGRIDALRRTADVVHVFGHRGARGVYPENTLAGFQYALDVGLNAIEVDVLASRDGIAVLTHNRRLWRDTTRDMRGDWLDRDGPLVRNLSFHGLQDYDVGGIRPGSAYAAQFPDQTSLPGLRIPSLADLCDLIAPRPDFWLNIEIKSFAPDPFATASPEELTDITLRPLRDFGLEDRTVVQSFDWRVLRAFQAAAPQVVRSYLTQIRHGMEPVGANIYPNSPWLDGYALSSAVGALPEAVADLGGQVWCPYFRDVTEQEMTRARDLGLLVNVWTVNEVADLTRMVDLGVDGIITDYPVRAQQVLAERGLRWRHDAPAPSVAPH